MEQCLGCGIIDPSIIIHVYLLTRLKGGNRGRSCMERLHPHVLLVWGQQRASSGHNQLVKSWPASTEMWPFSLGADSFYLN